jgi:TonB family protein
MYRRLTFLALTIATISGASKLASGQLEETPLSGELKALVIYAPRPQYPHEAFAKRLTGRGIVWLNVASRTGHVTSARMLKGTGHSILDQATLDAYRQWRFKPGTVAKMKIPITFTMQGARY